METLWSCRTCMACVEVCPVAIEHVPIIVQMRRKLVEDGEMDPQLRKTLQTIHKTGNSFGESKRKRAAWTKCAAVSRSRTRARSRSTCSGSSATTPRSIRATRR